MTTIPINESFLISLDAYAWRVMYPKKFKWPDSDEHYMKWVPTAWFPKLSMACEWIIEQQLAEKSDLEGAQSVIAAINAAKAEIIAAINAGTVHESWYAEMQKGGAND